MPKAEGTFSPRKNGDPLIAQERNELVAAIKEAGVQLQQTYARFDQIADPDLIEACVYEINALQARHSYLLRRVKEIEAE